MKDKESFIERKKLVEDRKRLYRWLEIMIVEEGG